MDNSQKQILLAETSSAVSFTSLMTAVTVFFTGFLISTFKNYDPSVKVPLLFLIVSTFSFLFSTLLYANASGLVARLNSKEFDKCMKLGNVLSEYGGVYLLVFAIPLVINLVTIDPFITVTTLAAALGGLTFYHLSGFSLLKRHYKATHHGLFLASAFLETGLFVSQLSLPNYFLILAFLTLILVAALTFLAEDEN